MDSALKEILKEERKRKDKNRERREDKHHSDKHREKNHNKHHSEKNRDKHREKNRHEKRREEKESDSIEIIKVEQIEEEKFMFLYEDKEGKLFPNLDLIAKESNVKIFPVYFHGHNTNLSEEEITFKDGKWTSVNEEAKEDETWLTIKEDEILPFDLSDVVAYNNLFFHCVDDLFDYIKEFGADYLPVNKE